VLNGTEWPRPITGQYPTRIWNITNCKGVLVRPTPSRLLLMNCRIIHEWLKEWITQCFANKLNLFSIFRINDTVSVNRPTCLSVLISASFKNLNYFLVACFADAVLCCYSVIKTVLYHLPYIRNQSCFICFETQNAFYLTAFRVHFKTFWG
jgi:hypothetical protein